jgi:hypothetical protein
MTIIAHIRDTASHGLYCGESVDLEFLYTCTSRSAGSGARTATGRRNVSSDLL